MTKVLILAIGALALTACTKQAATVTQPTAPASPNIGVLVTLNGLALGCEVWVADDVDPSVLPADQYLPSRCDGHHQRR